jgi:hypothetical protein
MELNLLEKPRPKSEIVTQRYSAVRNDIWLIYCYSPDAAAFVMRECPTFGKLAWNPEAESYILMITPGFNVQEVIHWVQQMGIAPTQEQFEKEQKEKDAEDELLNIMQRAMLVLKQETDTTKAKKLRTRRKKNDTTEHLSPFTFDESKDNDNDTPEQPTPES